MALPRSRVPACRRVGHGLLIPSSARGLTGRPGMSVMWKPGMTQLTLLSGLSSPAHPGPQMPAGFTTAGMHLPRMAKPTRPSMKTMSSTSTHLGHINRKMSLSMRRLTSRSGTSARMSLKMATICCCISMREPTDVTGLHSEASHRVMRWCSSGYPSAKRHIASSATMAQRFTS